MSYWDYTDGRKIAYENGNFYGIIQAAMRLADTRNLDKLKEAWPEVWKDLQARYNAPEGKLSGEDWL